MLPFSVTPTMLADVSAVLSCRWTVTSTESPTLINVPTSGESIEIVGLVPPDDAFDPDPPLVGNVPVVGSRVSQLATITSPNTSAVNRVNAERMISLQSPRALRLARLGRLLPVVDDVRRDEN